MFVSSKGSGKCSRTCSGVRSKHLPRQIDQSSQRRCIGSSCLISQSFHQTRAYQQLSVTKLALIALTDAQAVPACTGSFPSLMSNLNLRRRLTYWAVNI